jgi:hypothetical protein
MQDRLVVTLTKMVLTLREVKCGTRHIHTHAHAHTHTHTHTHTDIVVKIMRLGKLKKVKK